MTNLLAPFSSQTDILQANSLSLSLVLPSLMDLECHLQQLPNAGHTTATMLADLQTRFSSILDSQSSSSCLWVVTVACLERLAFELPCCIRWCINFSHIHSCLRQTGCQASYPQLAPLAQDLIAAPASQAYTERVFSVCGWLTAGHRNRLTRNLEMRAFLKMNKDLVW